MKSSSSFPKTSTVGATRSAADSSASTDYKKIKELFAAALDVAPEERERFLDERCEREDLRLEVESLLATRDEAGEFLDVSAVETIHDSLERDNRLSELKIGKYRIEREIGRGGMGVVFLAAREDFQQQVALKLIKRGMDSDAVLERFRREREILAALNHPFIARLLDGGATETDAPFFVMEYVEGVAVDEFCRERNLSERETLELFRRVCEAVTYAHQKLVVHRDLKPSNILITKDGTPKLLDFGIAKLLDATDAPQTQTVQRILTPAYASPEQTRGEQIGTASDVYSLGIILCELLEVQSEQFKIDSSKFKFKSRARNKNSAVAPDEIPTTANNDDAQRIQNPKSKIQNVKGDLQNILAMSLRADAARRYGSVENFSADIDRYLNDLPVSARADTFFYRANKFVRRNSIAVAAAVVFAAVLIAASIVIIEKSREAERERALAESRFDNLRKMSGSFIAEVHGAIENLPGSLPARRLLLKRGVEQLDSLAAEAGENRQLQDELAQSYAKVVELPDMPLAEKDATLRKEIAIYENLIRENPTETRYVQQLALADISLGDITKVRGSVAGAVELEKTGVSLLENLVAAEPENAALRVDLCGSYVYLAIGYYLSGSVEAAMQASRRNLSLAEETLKLNPDDAREKDLADYHDIARVQIGIEQTLAGEPQAAVAVLREAVADYETAHAANPNDTAVDYYLWIANRRLAIALEASGNFKEATERFETALSIIENLLAQSPKDFGYHRNCALTHIFYGELLVRQNRRNDALPHFRRAIELNEQVIENDADNVESRIDAAWARGNLGEDLIKTGSAAEGFKDLNQAAAEFEELSKIDTANDELRRYYAETRARLAENSPPDEAKNRAAVFK